MMFMEWQKHILPGVEICAIQLPGRGARMFEPPCDDLDEITDIVTAAILREHSVPFAFFGHSLGSLLAFEAAHKLAAARGPNAGHLFVGGSNAPRHKPKGDKHLLPDDQLIEKLREYNGTPHEILANQELMALILPTLRADLSLAETYAYRSRPPLAMPMTVFAGDRDSVDALSHVEHWADETAAACALHRFDGDHFFINSHRSELIAHINRTLQTMLAPSSHAA